MRSTLRHRVVASFDGQPPEVRMLLLVGVALLASGLLHVVVWLAAGLPSLAGPVSWRKPIVFGLSAGVTSVSLAWVVSLLPPSPWRGRWSALYAVTMGLEIFLIDLQQWRGVGSHFNVATVLDGAIFNAMGVLILGSAAAMVAFLVLVWRASSRIAVDARAAAIGGLLLTQLTVVVGLMMVAHGAVVAASHDGIPAVVAGRGLLKVPHGVALHGLQVLPVLAWLLSRAGVARAEGARWIHRATMGLGLVAIGALAGALAGRAPQDLPLPAAALVLAGMLTLLAVAARVAMTFTRTQRMAVEAL